MTLLEEFYRENYPIVLGYLFSLCRNRTLAEDLTSETFLKAIQYIKRYDGTCKPCTWLCTIAKNLYFNERKRQNRYRDIEEAEPMETISLEDQFVTSEDLRWIFQNAKQLPQLHQQVFFMRISGLHFREIGDALGKTENWARVTFFRIKHQLLEGYDDSL